MSRLLTLASAPVIAGALLLGPGQSLAQSGHSIMITDDGAGPQVWHMTMPDLRQARRPDFVRDDLPLFNEKLALDAIQRAAVRERLEAYLAEFDAVAKKSLPAMPERSGQIVMRGGPGGPELVGHGDHGVGGGLDGMVRDAIGDVGTLDIDHEAGPGGMTIAIRAGVGGPIPGGDEDGPAMIIVSDDEEGAGDGTGGMPLDSGVVVAIETGEDIPEELREELKKKAEAMADRLREQMAQGEMDGPGAMRMLGSPEDRAQHFEELAAQVKAFELAKVGLKQQFVTDVRAMLQPDQLDQWPTLDRALVRKKTLPDGRLAGERTDLTQVLGNIYLSEAEQEGISETLWGYEMSLHDALSRRNAYLASAEKNISKAMKNGEPDRAITVADRGATLRAAVRDVNDSYLELLAGQLQPDTASAFRRRALEVSYPKIYRERYADKVFAAAQRIDGLDDETRVGMDELHRAYRAEVATMNEQIRRVVKQHEPAQTRRALEHVKTAMESGGSMGMGISGDEAIREAYQRRAALDDRYVKYLHDMLTPAQVALLPAKPKRSKGPIIIERSANEEY